MKQRLLLFLLLLPLLCSAQKHDYFWIFGYEGGSQSAPDDEWANTILDFNTDNEPAVQVMQQYDMNFSATCATICDSSGQLLFYTNGEKIYHKLHSLMDNGEGLNMGDGYGFKVPQGALILPQPGSNTLYHLVYMDIIQWPGNAYGYKVKHSIIDMTQNNGLGAVVLKNQVLIADTMGFGQISGVKHANGRDWWVLVSEHNSPRLYEFLITPAGILSWDTLGMGLYPVAAGFGQSIFSPDGSKYIRANSIKIGDPYRVDVYDFDRCSGALSNQRSRFFDYPGFGVGAAVSPDSRYLYILRTNWAFQYDLWADEIFDSQTTVATFDGFVSGVYANVFHFAQPGPDGRIYVGSQATFHIHQINYPSRQGAACDFQQHSINLQVYQDYTIPNFPNFRLGPLDGSACDSLGLNNKPVAHFRWEPEEVLNPWQITFSDLSYYEPTEWWWDFGDGITSSEQFPVHTYNTPGAYEVCLEVSNAYGSSSFCRQVVLLSAAGAPQSVQQPVLWPTPFTDQLRLELPEGWEQGRLNLHDVSGKLVLETSVLPGMNQLAVPELSPGLYFWQVYDRKGKKAEGKTERAGN